MTTRPDHRPPAGAAAPEVQARLGSRLAGVLALQSERLPHDIHERLRFAREQALQRARGARASVAARPGRQPVQAPALAGAGGGGPRAGRPSWWLRTAGLLPLLLLLVGLVAVQGLRDRERVATAAAIDAELLADDLPPSAWSDPGFAEFLRSSEP